MDTVFQQRLDYEKARFDISMSLHLNIKPQRLAVIIHWRSNGADLHRILFLGMRFVEKAMNDEFL